MTFIRLSDTVTKPRNKIYMCVCLINKPNSLREPKENLFAMSEVNQDGIGVAYNLQGKLIVKKGFPSFEEFYQYYSAIPNESSVMTHFRKSSSGAICDENLHPFTVNENLCLIFNGTITELNWETQKSDTFILNESIIKPLMAYDLEMHEHWFFKKLIESFIGQSKMVMLDNNGKLIFFNEIKGTWNSTKDVWYSNMIWQNKLVKKDSNHKHKNKCKDNNSPTFYCQPNLNLPNLGSLQTQKKKYYRTGDPYYQELSPEELVLLAKKNNCGIKKLNKRKRLISLLEDVPDDKRLEGRLLYFRDQNTKKNLKEKNNLLLLENKKDIETDTAYVGKSSGVFSPLSVTIGTVLEKALTETK